MDKSLDVLDVLPVDPKPTRLPPIGIMDIMVLTTAMALVFMLQGKLERQHGTFHVNPVFDFIVLFLYAVPAGISMAATYWLIKQNRITGRFHQQPGHWFLGAYLANTLGTMLIWVAYIQWGVSLFESQGVSVIFGAVAVMQIAAGAYLAIGVGQITGTWRWLLGVVAMTIAAGGLVYLVQVFPVSWLSSIRYLFLLAGIGKYLIPALGLILLVLAIVRDINMREARDWLHWAGVVVIVFELFIIPILGWIMIYFIRLDQP